MRLRLHSMKNRPWRCCIIIIIIIIATTVTFSVARTSAQVQARISMPTRLEKTQSHQLWRVTLLGKPAVKWKAIRTLQSKCGKRGRAAISTETAAEDMLVLRWEPPRKYDTVRLFISQIIGHDRFQLAPVLGPADDHKGDDQKEGVEEGNAVDEAPMVAEAASVPSLGQSLSASFLPLKLEALLQNCPAPQDCCSTPGLRVFEDALLGEGSFGTVYKAEYGGEVAAAKVFAKSNGELARENKKQKVSSSRDGFSSARLEVAASAAFPVNKIF